MANSTIPILDRATIEFAARLAPVKLPDPRDTEREIWMKVGAAALVQKLTEHLTLQEKMALVSLNP